MDPPSAQATGELALSLIEKAQEAFHSTEVKNGLRTVCDLIGRSRYFEAMKTVRSLYAPETARCVRSGGAAWKATQREGATMQLNFHCLAIGGEFAECGNQRDLVDRRRDRDELVELRRLLVAVDDGTPESRPHAPMDPSAMVTQLATVSQVGQSVKTNTTLSSMLVSNSLPQAELLVGQIVLRWTGRFREPSFGVGDQFSGAQAAPSNGETLQLSQRRGDPMTEGDVLDLVQGALWTMIVIAGPVAGASMIVGVAIALLQALTQVQEADSDLPAEALGRCSPASR